MHDFSFVRVVVNGTAVWLGLASERAVCCGIIAFVVVIFLSLLFLFGISDHGNLVWSRLHQMQWWGSSRLLQFWQTDFKLSDWRFVFRVVVALPASQLVVFVHACTGQKINAPKIMWSAFCFCFPSQRGWPENDSIQKESIKVKLFLITFWQPVLKNSGWKRLESNSFGDRNSTKCILN